MSILKSEEPEILGAFRGSWLQVQQSMREGDIVGDFRDLLEDVD